MKILLNLEENLQLKIRRDIFKLSASVPENFRFFCITFKQKDKSALKRLSYYIENDVEILYFIMQAEKKYNINTALNRCLIEKYLRKDNNLFLNQIKNFMHNEFSNN